MTVEQELKQLADPEKAAFSQRFFRTGKGEYAEGDVFLGITVPKQRAVAKQYADLSRRAVKKLLTSKIHEHRLTALYILVGQYANDKKRTYDFYMQHLHCINNWDLVDSSAYKIVGEHLLDKERTVLYTLARSRNLWERRIAMISTYAFIRKNDFADALAIAELLVDDEHDLIHKAVGWMLREIGKRDLTAEERFLKKHYTTMPRTMLRYAIEKFTPAQRTFYMRKP
ncbi:MAG: DNA alkylation repair protein [Candidatus Woesearchaeota archaeon]|nr:DNA alkylation repair protein [Candidatus Woesearchaeota archaeon]